MKKRLSGILVLLLAVALLAACRSKDETPTPPPPLSTEAPAPTEAPTAEEPAAPAETVTIRFAVNDFEQALYQDLITAFEEDNPDVEIKVVSINETLDLGPVGGEWPDDAWVRLASAADVINVQASREAVEAGLILDLTPSIETDPNTRPDDFYPDTLSDCQWDGGAWCLPTNAHFQLIFFDKDAFDEVGEPYPEPGWTWDDLLVKATALTKREGDEVTRWGFVLPGNNHLGFIDSWVGPLVDNTADPPEPLFDRPKVREAVAWYTDLYLEHQVMPIYQNPGDESVTVPEGQKLIDEQRVAMWPHYSGLWSWLSQQRNVGIVPFPVDGPGSGGRADHTTPLRIDAASVSAGTAQPQAAWRWLNYLNQQKTDLLGLQVLPARRSVAEASGFWDDVDEEYGAALEFALDHAYVMQWQTGYDVLSDAIDAVLNGEKSVEDALADAQTQARLDIEAELTDKAQATPVPTVVVAAEEEQQVAPDATAIVFTPGPSAIMNLGLVRDLADRFQETHPDIAVDVQQPNIYGGGAAFSIKALAENADCFGWVPQFQDPENLDAILNLEPFLDADPSFDSDDFYPIMLERFTHQGQLWGLPAEASTYIIEYNQDLFDTAGVDYPALDWTVDEFLAVAVALTQGEDEEKVYGLVTSFYEVNDLVFMIERHGAVLMDDSKDPPTIDFSSDSVAEAMQWYVNLSAEYGVKPVYMGDIADILTAQTGALEREELINSGQGAMWTATGAMNVLGEREGLNVGVAPLPAGAAGAAGAYVSAEGYFISAGTEARQACWQWIAFLTSQPEAAQNIPARRSVAESDAFRQRVGDDRADTYLVTMAAADRPSSLQFLDDEPWMGVGLIWLGRAYSQAVDDEMPLGEALSQAQDTFDQYRACVIAADAFSDDESQQACVLEADPTFPAFIFGQ